jgi:ABC-2 type transport system permease protein
MQTFWKIASFNAGTYLTYPFELLAALLRPLIDFGLRIMFWGAIAVGSPNINLRHITAYLLTAAAISTVTLIGGVKFGSYLAKAIKLGDLNHALLLPTRVLNYELAEMVGSMGVSYIIAGIFLLVSLFIEPPRSIVGIGLFLVMLLIALAISFGLNVIIGSVAFYTTESNGIKNVFAHVINIFSGSFVPLSLFPGSLKQFALLLPFSPAVYGPTIALRSVSLTGELQTQLIVGILWALILIPLSLFVWRLSLRKYDAIGL